jgi:LPXTG-motif cell wall-anchored protein
MIRDGCEPKAMAGQIWPILGGLAIAAGVLLLFWAWRRRRRRWISDRKRLMEGDFKWKR